MRVGQTSLIVFLGKVLSSAIGFLGTVYFARVLGSEVIGIYATIVALITWLQLGGKVGVHTALTKRLSEGDEQSEFLAAGVVIVAAATSVVTVGLFVFRSAVETYVDEFGTYTDVSVLWFVVILFVVQISYQIINAVLQGQHLVHVVGLLRAVRTGLINGVQFVLVAFFGFSVIGLVGGHAVGITLTALAAVTFVSGGMRRPRRRHFIEIYEYAKYSWFGELSSRTFSNADILILSVFVPSNLVGVYSVSWALSSFLNLFSSSISSTIFPEISEVSTTADLDATAGLIEDAIAFAGLLVIPGVVGGVLLDDRLMDLYGPEFGQGTQVLFFLLLSILAYSYFGQLTTALNGLNRPDLVFWINLVFITSNVMLNVILINRIGWTGAAIASAVSTSLGLVLSYYALSQIVTLNLPVGEIGRQVFSAGVMATVVLGIRYVVGTIDLVQPNWIVLLGTVAAGAGTYVVVLAVTSGRFRAVIRQNSPVTALQVRK